MAARTLKDVLDAIAKLDAKVERKFDAVEKRFDDLDAELTMHSKVHREIEKDITALKGRPPRTTARPGRRPHAR
jgi:3-dehydroquinate dehydratase